uniref:Uncharacterized protein n=1 Tax=Tanacetum cinerariifolium TaxID=118510 RepID=A0A6L2J9V1_TANCI|nr:hypothetical protein [Tanacetum cinerariifolium]
MASGDIDRDTKYALYKLLQMGTVAEYQKEFEMLIKRVTIPSNPKTLDDAFSLAVAAEARFTDLQLLEFLSSYPSNLGEAFFKARITEARFEDENNQAVDTDVGDQENPDVKDKQEVKKADDQEIENIQNEEGKNVEYQQVLEANDEEVVLENIKSYLKKDKDEQGKKNKNKEIITFVEVGANKVSNPNGVFNDIGGVGYSKVDGEWVPARRSYLVSQLVKQVIVFYSENCFSILNAKNAGDIKSPLSADTFGNIGVDESETSGLKTHAKEVVDKDNGSALIFLVGHGTESEVVIELLKEFQE